MRAAGARKPLDALTVFCYSGMKVEVFSNGISRKGQHMERISSTMTIDTTAGLALAGVVCVVVVRILGSGAP